MKILIKLIYYVKFVNKINFLIYYKYRIIKMS